VRAFFLIGALATILGGAVFATRDASPAETPAPARSPDYSLTDEEAIAEFERLNAQLIQAYEERNIALAEAVFTSDSPMLPRVRKEIANLIESSVLSRTRFRVREIDVASSGTAEIVLKRVEDVYPRFERESGGDASRDVTPYREWTDWVMRQEDGRWLLHEATVTDRELTKRPGHPGA
jgi:hypothetical protein